MGEITGISWCHHTFNCWWGCVEVSAACDSCYARTWAKRMGEEVWGADTSRRFFGEAHWNEPLKWDRAAAKAGERRRVFCASMADVFERHASGDMNRNLNDERFRLWALIDATPNLDWLLLTKRPQNITQMIPARWLEPMPSNVWWGFTGERQREFDIRWRDIPSIVRTRGAVIFVSYEPSLGPLILPADFLALGPRGWCIGGGESGHSARSPHPRWFTALRDQCSEAGVAFHFKQWGEWMPFPTNKIPFPPETLAAIEALPKNAPMCLVKHDGTAIRPYAAADGPGMQMVRVGKKAAGRLLDGVTHDAFPSPLSSRSEGVEKGTVA